MAKARSIAYVNDVGGATLPFLYQKIDPATGAPFTSAQVTAVSIALYDAADGSALQASTGMTWDATLQMYRYGWTYTGAARRVVAVMTPTRAVGISAALTPVDYETVDMADTLARIGKNSEALTDPSAASGTLMSKVRGAGQDLDDIKGSGYDPVLDNLHQAKLKRDELAASIAALDLRQSTSLIVPARMAPSKTYTCRLRVRDDNGVPVAPTATPTIEFLEGTVTGITLGSVTSDGGTGLYKFNVVLDGTADPGTVFSIRAAWSRIEGAVTHNEEAIRSVEVDAFDAVYDELLADTQAVLDLLNNGTYGLSALDSDLNALLVRVGVDSTVSLHQKLGAFTAALNLLAILGGFTVTETVKKNIEAIQGFVSG